MVKKNDSSCTKNGNKKCNDDDPQVETVDIFTTLKQLPMQQYNSTNSISTINQKIEFVELMIEILSYFIDYEPEQDISNSAEKFDYDLINYDFNNNNFPIVSTYATSKSNIGFLTDHFRITKKYDSDGISQACRVAQSIYNDALYLVRQIAFILNGNQNITWKRLFLNFYKKIDFENYKKHHEKLTHIDFRIYYHNNPNASNEQLYKRFRNNPKSTIRNWKTIFRTKPIPYNKLLQLQKDKIKYININDIFSRLKRLSYMIDLKDKNRLEAVYANLAYLFKYTKNYTKLKSFQSQYVLMSLIDNLKSYCGLFQKYKSGDLVNKPNFPSWINHKHRLLFGKTQLDRQKKLKNLMLSSVRLSKDKSMLIMDLHLQSNYDIPNITIGLRNFSDPEEFLARISDISIEPQGSNYIVAVRYKILPNKKVFDENKVIGIDFGAKIIIALVNNFGTNPKLIKGKKIKKMIYFKNIIGAKKVSTYQICENLLNRYRHKGKSEPLLKNLNYHIKILEQRKNNTTKITGEKHNPKIIEFYKDIEKMKQFMHMFPDDKIYTDTDIKDAENFIEYIKSLYDKKLDTYYLLKKILKNKTLENQEIYLKSLLREYKTEYFQILNYFKRRMNKELHIISKYVIDYCIKHNVGNIAIGYNKGWKLKNQNMSKKFNRVFHSIPHYTLLQQLKYKAEMVGINLVTVPEQYTSIRSALDNEPLENIPKKKQLGFRGVTRKGNKSKDGINHKPYKARGLFYSKKSGKIIHSDVNAAFNIIKIAFPDLFIKITQSDMLKNPQYVDFNNIKY